MSIFLDAINILLLPLEINEFLISWNNSIENITIKEHLDFNYKIVMSNNITPFSLKSRCILLPDII
jgi:hypothetical protein